MEKLEGKVNADDVEVEYDVVDVNRPYEVKTSLDKSKNVRENLLSDIFTRLSNETDPKNRQECLSDLRMFSREKSGLDKLVTAERLARILDLGHLSEEDAEKGAYDESSIEVMKILCNLVYNSKRVQQDLPNTSCLRALVARMKLCSSETSQELKLFDCRLVFLITAFNDAGRKSLRELKGDCALIKVLADISKRCDGKEKTCKADDIALCCEILKTLFNFYLIPEETEADPSEKSRNLVSILYKLLVHNCTENIDEIQKNIANLLIVVPFESCKAIIPPASKTSKIVFQNKDMSAIAVLLDYFDRSLNSDENLSPLTCTFIRLVKVDKSIRKYLRLQILPPLKDVMTRPEEGTTLRAKLCKLLTDPVAGLEHLVAELLFILCKENSSRMIKYTGYGNAAGMLANKGLLGPAAPEELKYSSESEESDTEEYEKMKDQINPVTGCYEHPKPSPLEGMTDDQKEYEMMKLLGLVDKLTRDNIIQPCRIGEDGKPKPIEHVLELQEELAKQHFNVRESDSD